MQTVSTTSAAPDRQLFEAARGGDEDAFSWDAEEEAYLPFALNVLTFRGELISDVTAFVTRSIALPDREVYARWPEQPIDPSRLWAFFERFGLPARLD